jgi:hypothetical protein
MPLLFSQYFGVDPKALDDAGLLDPFLEYDVQLFIDPLLIEKSSNDILRNDGYEQFHKHFENLIRILAISENLGDAAWKGAEKLLSLQEPPENGLGYSRRARAGTSRPAEVRLKLLSTIKEVITLGSKDPEMLSLMGFLEEGIGPDTISDFTTRAMNVALSKITNEFCAGNGVAIKPNSVSELALPIFETGDRPARARLLVPKDVLRHLPLADSWSDVWAATEHNKILREKVSQMLGGIAEPTITEQKKAVKAAVMQSAQAFDEFLASVRGAASCYDPNDDVFSYYKMRDILLHHDDLIRRDEYKFVNNPEEVQRVAMDALDTFKHHVENGNLWEELWTNDRKPKRERSAQLIFFAIADVHCRVNKIDVKSEPNFGGGPVDFAFSVGYDARVLVEMKRSGGTVEHGYEKQLEFYKTAARTDFGIFVVIDYGDGGEKIQRINAIRQERIDRGERASEIVVIDAGRKLSASKRS